MTLSRATSSKSAPASQDSAASRAQNNAARELFDQFFSASPGDQELPGVLLMVDIAHVRPRARQPRTHFDEEKLDELARDIAELGARGGGVGGSGILQPLIVSEGEVSGAEEAPEADEATFIIVAGERRYRAALRAGRPQVPVIVRQTQAGEGNEALWEDALRENIQRETLTPLEEALAIQGLMRRGGYSVRAIATRLGKGKGYIEQRMALAKAGTDVQEMVSRRQDTLSIAREIDRVKEPSLRKSLIEAASSGEAVVKVRERIEAAQQREGAQRQSEAAPTKSSPVEPPPSSGFNPATKLGHGPDPRSRQSEPYQSSGSAGIARLLRDMASLAEEAISLSLADLTEEARQKAEGQVKSLEEKLAMLRASLQASSS